MARTTAVLTKHTETDVAENFRELPGAAFFTRATISTGTHLDLEALHYAWRLQRIRSDYERDGFEETLWSECRKLGFDSADIRGFVTNPAAITNCGYVAAGHSTGRPI
jgi:hypothetical protein